MGFSEFFSENTMPDLKAGDIIKVGKWKNKPVEVVALSTDENGQPTLITKTLNGRGATKERKMFPFKICKLDPSCTLDKDTDKGLT
jgi:hypothetical protein